MTDRFSRESDYPYELVESAGVDPNGGQALTRGGLHGPPSRRWDRPGPIGPERPEARSV